MRGFGHRHAVAQPGERLGRGLVRRQDVRDFPIKTRPHLAVADRGALRRIAREIEKHEFRVEDVRALTPAGLLKGRDCQKRIPTREAETKGMVPADPLAVTEWRARIADRRAVKAPARLAELT